MTYMIREINGDTGEVIDREMTQEEIIELETLRESDKDIREQEAAKQVAKSALLERLGITEEEAKLLLS